MNLFCKARILRALAVSSAIVVTHGALAASYPERPIRMIAPSSAGGPVDVIARALAQALSEALGQQVVVDNRAGAAGLIGSEMVATGSPDGYTVLFGFSGPLVIVPHLRANMPYRTLRDFAPVSLAAQAPYILLAHPSLPVNSVKDLIALAKARPGKLNYGSGGNGTGIHLAGELFKLTAGVDLVHVPYKGAAPAMTALIAHEVDIMFNGLPPTLPHVKSGRLKGLAVGGAKRSPLLPDTPTVAEASGLAFNSTGWYGVLAPAKTPGAVVKQLHAATVQALGTPSVKDALDRVGVEVVGSTPQEFSKHIREESAKWEKVIKAAGLAGKG